jgi:hypothetical protein
MIGRASDATRNYKSRAYANVLFCNDLYCTITRHSLPSGTLHHVGGGTSYRGGYRR